MKATRTAIEGALILQPKVFGDDRGFFMESYNQKAFDEAIGQHIDFVQDNHSRSGRGVLRGLHYQLPPRAQDKLVRVTQGTVWDVAVDLRRSSQTFGHWIGVELSGTNHRQLWLPKGLAHGFIVLSETADFLYKTSDFYSPSAEVCIRWDDATLAIAWPELGFPPSVSGKDAAGGKFDLSTMFD